MKEGHGAGERQRTESGLGNVEIDVSHSDFKNILQKDELNERKFHLFRFFSVYTSEESKLSLFRVKILCHTGLIKN